MLKKITVRHYYNPLKKDIFNTLDVAVTPNKSIQAILIDLNIFNGSFYVKQNGLFLSAEEVEKSIILENDLIEVHHLAGDPFFTAAVIWTFEAGAAVVSAASLTALGSFIVSTAVTITLNLLVNALAGKPKINNDRGKENRSIALLGIGSAGNSTREYAPLPLGFGKSRIFPDNGARQFTDYCINNADIGLSVTDYPTTQPVLTPQINIVNGVPTGYTSNFQTSYGTATRNYYFYGAQRTYNSPISAGGNLVNLPCTFVVWQDVTPITDGSQNGTIISYQYGQIRITTYEMFCVTILNHSGYDWLDNANDPNKTFSIVYTNPFLGSSNVDPYTWTGAVLATSGNNQITLNVIQYFGTPDWIQRLSVIFNAGFGDAIFSDERIGKTRLADFFAIQANQQLASATYCNFSSDNTSIGGWQHPYYAKAGMTLAPNNATFKNYNKYDGAALNFINGEYPANLEVVEGGTLSRTKNLSTGVESTTNQGWVIRQGGSKNNGIYAIELDFGGRLFKNDVQIGVVRHSIKIDIYYRVGQTTNTQAQTLPTGNGWQPLSLDYLIENENTNGFYRTIFFEVPQVAGDYPKNIEIAVRKKAFDPTDDNFIEDIKLEAIKFFTLQTQKYPAQNRIGLQVKASTQLNGQLDRFSCMGSFKCFVLKASGGSNSWLPTANGKNWVWEETSNPAWWFLYFALGGYLNESTPAGHPLHNKGWMIGQDTNNKNKLFGLGESHQNIDLSKVANWADFCDAKGLKFDYFMTDDGAQSCFETLNFIAKHGRAKMTRNISNGKLSVVFHDENDPVKAIFTMSNIKKDTFSLTYNNKKTYDSVILSYPDAAADYATKQIRVLTPFTTNANDVLRIDLKGCTNAAQAQKEANLAAAAQFYGTETCEFEVDAQRLLVDVGDVVKITHDALGYADSFRLEAVYIDAAKVKKIKIDKNLDINTGTNYYFDLRTPKNQILSMIAVYLGDGYFNINTDWSSFNAPYIVNTNDFSVNAASDYFDSLPIDFIGLGGAQTTAGSLFRILSISPVAGMGAKLTCVREYKEYYACENGINNALPPADLSNVDVAYVANMGLILENDTHTLYWDNVNCLGAILSITATINNIVTNGQISVDNDFVVLPKYAKGTILNVSAMPKNIKTTYLQKSADFSFEV